MFDVKLYFFAAYKKLVTGTKNVTTDVSSRHWGLIDLFSLYAAFKESGLHG